MASGYIRDVRKFYFQRNMLTRIYGQLHVASLRILSDQLKVNTSSVSSIFGDGMFDHLGLLIPVQ